MSLNDTSINNLSVTWKLLQSSSDIQKLILNAMHEEMVEAFREAALPIRNRVRDIIIAAIKAQPEYSSLKEGELWHQLGLDSSEQRVDGVVNYWEESIGIEVTTPVKSGKGLKCKIILFLADSNFRTEIKSQHAIIRPKNSKPFSWLKYLLLEGDAQRLAPGYRYEPLTQQQLLARHYSTITDTFGGFKGNAVPFTRTGLGVMAKGGAQWTIPNEFRGTKINNWYTRALNSVVEDVENAFIEEIYKAIK
jgi:hypothetical protein